MKKLLIQQKLESMGYSLDNIICIDEISLNSFMIRRKCYEELGKRCVVKTERQEVFKKYTGIFAICSKGVMVA